MKTIEYTSTRYYPSVGSRRAGQVETIRAEFADQLINQGFAVLVETGEGMNIKNKPDADREPGHKKTYSPAPGKASKSKGD